MAKRKRLTPARPDFLHLPPEEEALPADPVAPSPALSARPEPLPEDLEHKAMFPMGVARTQSPVRPPIARVAGDASDHAALEELSTLLARARAEGRIVEPLALDAVDAGHLVRDRLVSDGEEMAALVASIRARGQQSPIEVIDRGAGAIPRYGLISGWRRLAALRQIAQEGEMRPVLAVIRQPRSAPEAYVAMVEENEIRADISFYERARIVVKALEQGIFETPKEALQILFANVSRAKRSKIKSFMTLVQALDGALQFPAAISERAGLDLVRRLETDPDLAGRLREQLLTSAPQTQAEEAALLASGPASQAPSRAASPAPACPGLAPDPQPGTFAVDFDAGAGVIRIAGPGVDADLLRRLQLWLRGERKS